MTATTATTSFKGVSAEDAARGVAGSWKVANIYPVVLYACCYSVAATLSIVPSLVNGECRNLRLLVPPNKQKDSTMGRNMIALQFP